MGLPLIDQEPPRPKWIRVRAPTGDRYTELRRLIEERRLHTVCSSAACPNIGECWNAGTATFMIMGNECTRACRFCDVKTSNKPKPLDLEEPKRLAEAAQLMALEHVVITSVARDDVKDGGAEHFYQCIRAVYDALPDANVEVLVPDFGGERSSIRRVLEARPRVFNHNLETVARLTNKVRSKASYGLSLDVLAAAKVYAPDIHTKSGLMLGLGETDEEVEEAIRDLWSANVDILTLGQYLRPSGWHLPVKRYVTPEQFERFKQFAEDMGFRHVESGPLVRSSYHAEKAVA